MAPICHGFKSSIRGAYKDTIDDSKQSPVSKFVKWSHKQRNTNYSTVGQPIKNRSANETDWQDESKCGGVRMGLGQVGSKLAVGIGISCTDKLAVGIAISCTGKLAVGIAISCAGKLAGGKLAVGIGISCTGKLAVGIGVVGICNSAVGIGGLGVSCAGKLAVGIGVGILAVGIGIACAGKLAVGIGSLAVGSGIVVIGIFGIGKLTVGVGWLGIVLVAKRTDSAGGRIGATGTFKAMAGNWAGLYASGRFWRSWVARVDARSI
eukprot:scaffold56381_cov62-Attheya_sp.AAC.2